MNNILENKSNYLIIKDDDFIKLFSFRSLVAKYNLETKAFENVPYTYLTINGTSSNHSSTTTRHISKFKKFIDANF